MGIDIKRLPAPIKAFFNAIAQVVFIENVISGMFFYVSFWIAGLEMANWDFASWDAWKYVVAVTIGVNISNLTAYLMGCDKNAIKSGLYGFAPNLFSIGCATFTGHAPGAIWTYWIVLGLGSILIVPLQIFINKFANHFGLPGFTLPFIMMTWFFILVSFSTGLLDYGREGVLATSATPSTWMFDGGFDWNSWDWQDWMLVFTNSFEEIWVMDGWIGSFICIAGYLWYNWQFGLKACFASAFIVGMGFVFGADMGMMNYALYGYSALLTIGALDTFGKSKLNGGRYWFLFFLGLVVTCLLNYAITPVLSTFGLPNMTLAFVLTGWFILIVERFMIECSEKRKAGEIK